MSKKLFLFGTIASVIAINSVFADTIVTSKSYVDTTRQATIPVAGTNEDEPGETVVTYTGTAGQIGERGICNNEKDDDCAPNDLVTVRELDFAVMNNMPTGERDTVVMYNGIGGQIGGSRGIYDGSTTYDSSTDADKLVTASVVQNATNLPEKTVTHRICTSWIDGQSHTDANCLLWNLVDETVYGAQCNTADDCEYPNHCSCVNHMCECRLQ